MVYKYFACQFFKRNFYNMLSCTTFDKKNKKNFRLTGINYKYEDTVPPHMKRTPCEYMMWNGLPVIRKEIAESMIKNHGLNQKEAAEKLGVTPAAVCQYLSKKRGKTKIVDQVMLKEINSSAERIIKQEDGAVIEETCRICRLFMNSNYFPSACGTCPSEK